MKRLTNKRIHIIILLFAIFVLTEACSSTRYGCAYGRCSPSSSIFKRKLMSQR